jgi:hypothetical protein
MFPAAIKQPSMPSGRPPRPSSTSSGHGRLYAFHQLIGRADVLFEESAIRLTEAGHRDEAALLWRSLVGRDVLEGRWTFEIVERFDDDYYDVARSEVAHLEQARGGGRRHAHEEELRRQRRALWVPKTRPDP